MKKIIFIICLSLGLSSCALIDKLEDQFADFTRVWNLQKQFINNIEQDVISCTINNKFDIADNNILLFYKYDLDDANCKSSTNSGRWSTFGNSLTINWDEPIAGESSYNIEIVQLTQSTLKMKRKLINGDFLEEIYN